MTTPLPYSCPRREPAAVGPLRRTIEDDDCTRAGGALTPDEGPRRRVDASVRAVRHRGETRAVSRRRSTRAPRATTAATAPSAPKKDRLFARLSSQQVSLDDRVLSASAGAKNSALFLAAEPRRVTLARLPHKSHVIHDRHRGPAPPLERLSRLYPPRMRPRRRPDVPSRSDDRQG